MLFYSNVGLKSMPFGTMGKKDCLCRQSDCSRELVRSLPLNQESVPSEAKPGTLPRGVNFDICMSFVGA